MAMRPYHRVQRESRLYLLNRDRRLKIFPLADVVQPCHAIGQSVGVVQAPVAGWNEGVGELTGIVADGQGALIDHVPNAKLLGARLAGSIDSRTSARAVAKLFVAPAH